MDQTKKSNLGDGNNINIQSGDFLVVVLLTLVEQLLCSRKALST